MRVLHVDSALGWRGGQNQVWLTAKGMAARGHEVLVACRRGGRLAARLHEDRLPVREISFHGDFWPAAILALHRLAREFRPSVVQLHDPHAVSTGLLAGKAVKHRIATRRVDFPLKSGKYRHCERVIAVSRAIASLLAQGGVCAERVRVVYEGVPDRPAEGGGRQVFEALGIPAGAPVVGNVAALTDHKDHRTLLEAAALARARVPEARFLILGEGELRASLEARAHELGLSDRVVFAGFRTDLDRLIPAFSILCLSSHHEGLGTSLLDAMNFGRPIVATNAGGISEAVEDGVSGRVVETRAPQQLADALCEILLDPERGAAMGAAGRQRFLERFSTERMLDATLRVYAELL